MGSLSNLHAKGMARTASLRGRRIFELHGDEAGRAGAVACRDVMERLVERLGRTGVAHRRDQALRLPVRPDPIWKDADAAAAYDGATRSGKGDRARR